MSTAFTTGHSALGTRKAIVEAGESKLHLNIPITTLDTGLPKKHPAILYSSYIKTLGDLGKLDVLHANADLGKFWEHCGLATQYILCLGKNGTTSFPST